MKKILFICKYLSTSNSGFESRLSTIIKYFKKNRYEVCAITSSVNSNKKNPKTKFFLQKIDKVNYYFINDIQNYSNYSFKRILSWINFEYRVFKFDYSLIKFKPEIIYISSVSLLTIINGWYLKKKYNAKLIFEMRDFWPYFLYTSGKFNRYNPFIIILGIIEKFGIYHSDLIISLIPRIKQYLIYRGFKKKSFASTFPVNKKYFVKKKNNFKLKKNNFNICYAGNFGYDNYLQDLLDLAAKIKNKSFVFHLIGNGSQKSLLKNKFSSVENINFYDKINYQDLHSVLIKMDCLILSFGFQDKYPLFGYELNKLNNYLMASKPILVLGSKKNLMNSRGEFTFVSKKNPLLFEKKLKLIKKKYNFFLNKAKINKKMLLLRNSPDLIFKTTVKYIENL
jgi:hypothetical protein